MSWFTDPELFIDKRGTRICHLWRCRVKFGSPIYQRDFTLIGQVTNHLSLIGNAFPWNKSHFDALTAYLSDKNLVVNCQGLVIVPSYAIAPNGTSDMGRSSFFWSNDVLNLPRYGLTVPSVPFRVVQYIEGGVAPVETSPKESELAKNLAACKSDGDRKNAEKAALEKKVSDLEAKVSTLENEVKREKNDKEALKKQVADLTAKLEECRASGSAGKEAWMNSTTVPSEWVPFEKLVVKLRRNSPFTITRSGANFIADTTTNVSATYFSRALADGNLEYPIKVVSVEDLIPNKEKARFDPNVWGLLDNSGTLYAFRKQN